MTEAIRDPVNRIRMAFEPQGENLIVHAWLEPGGGLPAHLHPRQTERWSVLGRLLWFETRRVHRLDSHSNTEPSAHGPPSELSSKFAPPSASPSAA